jgi:ABC-type transporter Mla MlaB component
MVLREGTIGERACLVLGGDITEEADFAPLLASPLSPLLLDLVDVGRINSSGVREWLSFVREIAATGRRLVLLRCAPAMVQQANMITNFLGAAEVRSLLAPYYCAPCDYDHREEISTAGKEETPLKIAEAVPCPRCGRMMEFSDLASEYLAFLNAR